MNLYSCGTRSGTWVGSARNGRNGVWSLVRSQALLFIGLPSRAPICLIMVSVMLYYRCAEAGSFKGSNRVVRALKETVFPEGVLKFIRPTPRRNARRFGTCCGGFSERQ